MKASELNEEELKNLKKQLKLPVKKQIIYYKQIAYHEFQSHIVVDFEIIKEFTDMKVLIIELDNGTFVNIISDYLAEMQKSNFVQKMKEE